MGSYELFPFSDVLNHSLRKESATNITRFPLDAPDKQHPNGYCLQIAFCKAEPML